ncbi:MAG: type III-A CRISPR-associated protein Csm2 [Caldilineaceae bacterium]|nr:type III-A CRISPR-associated protein Csm2 [Caldilineaceae bacterium]
MPDVQTNLQLLRNQGFYDDHGRVRSTLFDEVARDLGQAFADNRRRGGTGVSSSQLRNFYSEVKALEIRLQEMSRAAPDIGHQADGEDHEHIDIAPSVFRTNEYMVRMIGPKIAYIQGKKTGGNVSREFREFIENSLANVQNERDFKVFMRLFESVVGYFYGFEGGRN